MRYRGIPNDQKYDQVSVEVSSSHRFYMTTDGLVDQVGGANRRMFGKRRFVELLTTIHGHPLQAQKDRIVEALASYQGEESRRDDVSMIGFRI